MRKLRIFLLIITIVFFVACKAEETKGNVAGTAIIEADENNIEESDIAENNIEHTSLANADRPLNIPTYVDTDNHATHPRVFKDETKKYGYEWIMAFTPYSQGQDQFENPSIVVSDNGIDWFVPKCLTNPIVAPKKPDEFHFSDTDLFDNGEELELCLGNQIK